MGFRPPTLWSNRLDLNLGNRWACLACPITLQVSGGLRVSPLPPVPAAVPTYKEPTPKVQQGLLFPWAVDVAMVKALPVSIGVHL